jgi:hypothetical protein
MRLLGNQKDDYEDAMMDIISFDDEDIKRSDFVRYVLSVYKDN